MWPTWLLPLIVLSNDSSPNINNQRRISDGNSELQNVEFSIEEVLLLNRRFVDYLVEIGDQESSVSQCLNTLRQLAQGYLDRQRLGLEWFDSWGKVPSGLYYQNGYAFGNVDQCRAIAQVRMQHCTLIAAFPGDMALFFTGLCVPHSCPPDYVAQIYGEYLTTQSMTLIPLVSQETLCIRDEEIRYDGAMITAFVISSLIGLCVLCSTLYELISIALKREAKRLYSAFSLLGNVRTILHLLPREKNTDRKSSMIDCAHGIRSLSMIWIIVVHVHETSFALPMENTPAWLEYLEKFIPTVLFYGGGLAVDTFLMLSGMLVAMSMLRELDKEGKFNPLMLYIHRYIRITAPLAALILFVVSFAIYMGEGVYWKAQMDSLKQPCLTNWWTALLHIQNYVDPANMCLTWTWYLSVDMQLYILAPALIYPLWRYGKRVLIVIASIAILSMACVLTSFLVNEIQLTVADTVRYKLTYYATHARMAVWLWGLAFGYLLHKTKDTRVKLPNLYWTLGWMLCFTLLGLIFFANYKIYATNAAEFSFVADAFFEPLSRSLFAFCVMWIILACVNGKGGLLDEFLGAAIWQPLSRLSYTMYLLHTVMLGMSSLAPINTSTHFSVIDLFYRIWGAIGLTTSVSLLWSAIFEIPFGTLDRLLLRK